MTVDPVGSGSRNTRYSVDFGTGPQCRAIFPLGPQQQTKMLSRRSAVASPGLWRSRQRDLSASACGRHTSSTECESSGVDVTGPLLP